MPKKLSIKELLSHKEYIKDVAEKLGFLRDIHVGKHGNATNVGQLTFLVTYNNEQPSLDLEYSVDPKTALEKWLTFKFDSLFYLISDRDILRNARYKYVKESAVNIDDEEGLAKLYGKRLEDMLVANNFVEDPGDLKFTIPELEALIEPNPLEEKEQPKLENQAEVAPDTSTKFNMKR